MKIPMNRPAIAKAIRVTKNQNRKRSTMIPNLLQKTEEGIKVSQSVRKALTTPKREKKMMTGKKTANLILLMALKVIRKVRMESNRVRDSQIHRPANNPRSAHHCQVSPASWGRTVPVQNTIPQRSHSALVCAARLKNQVASLQGWMSRIRMEKPPTLLKAHKAKRKKVEIIHPSRQKKAKRW